MRRLIEAAIIIAVSSGTGIAAEVELTEQCKMDAHMANQAEEKRAEPRFIIELNTVTGRYREQYCIAIEKIFWLGTRKKIYWNPGESVHPEKPKWR